MPVKAEIDEAIQRVSQLVLNSPTELKEILSALGAIEQKYGEQAPAERIEKIRQEARESSLRARAEAYFSALVSRDWQKAATFLSRSSPDGQSVENKAEGLKWRANRRQKWHGGSAHTFQIINARADLDGTALVEFIVKSLDGTQMEPRVRSNSWQLKDHVWLLKLGKHHR